MRHVDRSKKNEVGGDEQVEQLLRELRSSGRTMLESVLYLMKVTGWPVWRAKQVVHESVTWIDMKNQMEEFHDEIERATEIEVESDNS